MSNINNYQGLSYKNNIIKLKKNLKKNKIREGFDNNNDFGEDIDINNDNGTEYDSPGIDIYSGLNNNPETNGINNEQDNQLPTYDDTNGLPTYDDSSMYTNIYSRENGVLYRKPVDTSILDTKNNNELAELKILENKYNKALSDYTLQKQILDNMINNYISSKGSNLKNKNVRLPSGSIGYVTNNGLWKAYNSWELYTKTADKNSCPAGFSQVDVNINNQTKTIDIPNNPLRVGTPMVEGQACGLSGTNIYVTNTETPITTQNYSGCYKLNVSNDLTYQSDMGTNVSIDSCRTRAFDTNNSVFALSTSNGLNNSGKCYVGKNIDSVISGGNSIFQRVIWTQSLQPLVGAKSAYLNYAGQLQILNNQGVALWTSNTPIYPCDPVKGGTISIKYTNWGGNCDGDYPFSHTTSPDTSKILSVSQDNLTQYSKTIAENKEKASFNVTNAIILPETGKAIGDPAFGCRKNFYSSYGCGLQSGVDLNVIDKPLMMPGYEAIYDCQKVSTRCKSFILNVQNDLNLVLYDWNNDKFNEVWSSKTINIDSDAIETKEFNSISGKNGRSQLKAGESLLPGEFLGSENGKCMLVFVEDVGLQLKINISGCKKGSDNNYYGGNITDNNTGMYYTVYNGYFNDNLSFFNTASIRLKGVAKNISSVNTATNNQITSSTTSYSIIFEGSIYINKTGEWTFKLTSDDAGYMWIGNNAITNTNINNALISNGGFHAMKLVSNKIFLEEGNYYPIKIIFGNNLGPGGVIFKYSGPGVSERSDLTGYVYTYTPNDGLATYKLDIIEQTTSSNANLNKVGYITDDGKLKTIPSRLLSLSNDYIEIGNYNNIGSDILITDSTNVDKCKSDCNNNINCHGFVYKDNKCYLKNSNIYPNSLRILDNSSKLFKRNLKVNTHSSCNKNVIPVSSETWDLYPIDGELTEDTKCELASYIDEQKKVLSVTEENFKNISNELKNRLINLSENSKIIASENGITITKINNDLTEFKRNYTTYSEMDKTTENENAMKISSYDDLLSDNYNYLIWSILVVSIAIGGVYYIKNKK